MAAALVSACWRHVEVIERVPDPTYRALFRDELAKEAASAEAGLPLLKPWAAIPERVYATQSNARNRVRMQRVLELVRSGDRVLDIGINYGYLTCVLLREAALAAYRGVDLEPWYAASAKEALEVNDVTHPDASFGVLDVFDLTAEDVHALRADVVLCLEVLEHVPDAGRALRTLGAALGDEAVLIFSVPLLGRLEWVWGHRSVFPARRVQALLGDAGLFAHHVEPLHGQWMLVVAGKQPPDGRRHWAPAGDEVRRDDADRTRFSEVGLADPAALAGDDPDAAGPEPAADGPGVVCRMRDTRCRAVLRVPVEGCQLVRMDLELKAADAFDSLEVVARDRAGVPQASWRWSPERGPSLVERATIALRPGEPSAPVPYLRPGRTGDAAGTRWLEVRAAVRPGAAGELRLRRCEYVAAPG